MIAAIDHIVSVTGGYDHVGIGTDLDGFIEPIAECPNYSYIGVIEDVIRRQYTVHADAILFGNALRVLGSWRGVQTQRSTAARSEKRVKS